LVVGVVAAGAVVDVAAGKVVAVDGIVAVEGVVGVDGRDEGVVVALAGVNLLRLAITVSGGGGIFAPLGTKAIV
jgi:hypothetical protein